MKTKLIDFNDAIKNMQSVQLKELIRRADSTEQTLIPTLGATSPDYSLSMTTFR